MTEETTDLTIKLNPAFHSKAHWEVRLGHKKFNQKWDKVLISCRRFEYQIAFITRNALAQKIFLQQNGSKQKKAGISSFRSKLADSKCL